MSSVDRSQQFVFAEEKLPWLLPGVLQAAAWASVRVDGLPVAAQEPPGLAGGPLWLCQMGAASHLQPAWRSQRARVPQPGRVPFLRLRVSLGEHFAFTVGVSAAHPGRAGVRGAGIPAPCWGPTAHS